MVYRRQVSKYSATPGDSFAHLDGYDRLLVHVIEPEAEDGALGVELGLGTIKEVVLLLMSDLRMGSGMIKGR